VRLSSHRIELSAKQKAMVDAYLKSLAQNPYSPPGDLAIDPELLDVLGDQRQVVKVSDNVVFAASAYDEMVQRIVSHMKQHGKITVAEVRDMFQTSRKYALALMEHLDEQKVTRRVGDERVLR
jgi:selenocysteine-specific elongation factor